MPAARPRARVALAAVLVLPVGACGQRALARVSLQDIPTVTFMRCEIPPGQPTWAYVKLTGGEPPFRGTWSVDGEVDTTDAQRATPIPGGTELALLVTLRGGKQTLSVREFNRHGLVGTDSWTNDVQNPGPLCAPDGQPGSSR